MYGAPIAFAIIFILLLIACPFIFKPIFKIDSFFGYCQGVCCSVLTAITIVVAAIIGIIVFVSKASDVGGNADDALVAVGSGLLFLIFIVIVAAYFGVVFFLFCYSKRVSEPQHNYNSIFMFISGYNAMFIGFYFILLIILIASAGGDNTGGDKLFASFYVLWEFIVFFYIIKLAGISIMFMLHHRKVNPIILWCALGCYFGDLILILIALLAKKLAILEYPSFLFNIVSIGLGSFFYYRYSNQNASKGDTVAESPYQQA